MSRALPPTLALLAVLVTAAPAGAAVKAEFGKSIVLKPVNGSVLVKEPGERTRKVRAKVTVALGSQVDTRNGKVKLTSALRKGNKQQSARFNGARFRVTQPRRERGLTDLKILDNGAACPAGANAARRGGRLFGRGKGRFRTRGRNSSATVRGTTWVTEDTCQGTSITNVNGKVDTKADDANLGRLLEPGQTVTYYCEVRNRNTDGKGTYCILILSQPADRLFGMGIAALTDETGYQLCLGYPNGFGTECADLPLTEPDPELGFRQSAVVCFAKAGAGVYSAEWTLASEVLEPTMRTPRLRGADASYPNCLIEPPPPEQPASRAPGRADEGARMASPGPELLGLGSAVPPAGL
jgi:hypothetical protein